MDAKNTVSTNERFDKIFIIDLNPGNDELTKELVMGKFSRVIKNASLYQTLIFISHSSLILLKKLVIDIGVKNGFIVSDSGARIYNIETNKIVYDSTMTPENANAAIHYALMGNSLILVSSTQREYAYSMNLLNAISLNKRHYLPLPYTNDWNKFAKFIDTMPIHSVMVYHKNRNTMLTVFGHMEKVSGDWNMQLTPSQATYFIVTDEGVSKYNAVLKIMEHVKVQNFDNVHYYAINTINDQCMKAFKNHLIHQDVALNSSYYNRINIQANIDNMITNMRQAFFTNDETPNDTYTTKEIIDTKRLNEIMRTQRHNK